MSEPDWTKWQPTAKMVQWTWFNIIQTLKDGGRWGIPLNSSIWQLDKVRKVFTCIHGPKDDMIYHQLTNVCRVLGYTTEYAPIELPPAEIDQYMHGTGKTNVRIP